MGVLLIAVGVLGAYMTLLFALSIYFKNNGIADVGYGIGFLVVGLASLVYGAPSVAGWLLFVLLFFWAVRLSGRIFWRNKDKPEDFRYAAWRKEWGSTFVWRSFLQVYMLQGAVIFLVVLPITLVAVFPSEIHWEWVLLGSALWLVGYAFEVVGDAQLDRFLKDPANMGKIMQSGLWRYSRHPNYFGEAAMWWGMAIAALGASAFGILAFVSPLLITYLLLYVSGVPMLEKRFAGNPEWEAYKARTSVFVPLPPRH